MGRPRILPPAHAGDDPVSGSALAHQPEALARFQRLYGILWSRGVLDHPTKELARLRNARVTGCTYCKSVRFSVAKQDGLTEDIVDRIRDDHADSDLSPRFKAVLEYVDVFLSEPRALVDATRKELLQHLSPEQVVELTAALALFQGFSKIAVAIGGLPESLPVTEAPTPDWPEASPA